MLAAVRYLWMFRAAAAVFVLFGAALLWRFGLTGYEPQLRPFGLIAGVFALCIGVPLFRARRVAVGFSVAVAVFLALCATLAAPSVRPPAVLLFAALALLCIIYAVLAVRALWAKAA